ncbi:MAG: UDP-glucose 4-epimerase GalE [Lachnospiraceae bacterium]|nr:UDP-glucose 4-epimerase GalE [Lachnospiraceae bacterium]
MKKTVLLAGGAGYIASHTAIELMEAGYEVVSADCYYNSKPEVFNRLEKITGVKIKNYDVDVCDMEALDKVFAENKIDAVVHFAGYKAVGESVAKPMMYYENNMVSTFSLLKVMKKYNCDNLVFSSSATVYGMQDTVPFVESMQTGPCTNPYGWTKLMNEQILMDAAKADETLSVVLLRYFNPVGAHKSGLIGEDPTGIPNNLMPFISQVAVGKREHLNVFGDDYNTPDGTGVRDYIHVVDLAKAHVKAIDYALKNKGSEVFNIGTGVGYSVLDMVKAFEKANDIKVPYVIAPRRPGDIDTCYADSTKAEKMLGWKAEKSLEDMCRDTWNWQKNNPNGYEE